MRLLPSKTYYNKYYLDENNKQFLLGDDIPNNAVKLFFCGVCSELPTIEVIVKTIKGYKLRKFQRKIKVMDNFFPETTKPAETYKTELFQVISLFFKDDSKTNTFVNLQTNHVIQTGASWL